MLHNPFKVADPRARSAHSNSSKRRAAERTSRLRRLGLENEILTTMIAAPPLDAAMLVPK